jgi:hypothetical protein
VRFLLACSVLWSCWLGRQGLHHAATPSLTHPQQLPSDGCQSACLAPAAGAVVDVRCTHTSYSYARNATKPLTNSQSWPPTRTRTATHIPHVRSAVVCMQRSTYTTHTTRGGVASKSGSGGAWRWTSGGHVHDCIRCVGSHGSCCIRILGLPHSPVGSRERSRVRGNQQPSPTLRALHLTTRPSQYSALHYTGLSSRHSLHTTLRWWVM